MEDEEREGDVDPIDGHFDRVDARIAQLCEGPLKGRIAALEADRRKARGAVARGVRVLAVPIVLFFLSDEAASLLRGAAGEVAPVAWIADHMLAVSVALFLLAMGYIALVVALPGLAAYLHYRQRFKKELVGEVCRALLPNAAYEPDRHVTEAVFRRSDLWPGELAEFRGDDLMRGRIGGVEFEASELTAIGPTYVQTRRRSEQITRRPNATLFSGMFFHVGLERRLRGRTIVEPEATDGRGTHHRHGLDRWDPGDAAFSEYFRVYTSDPAEAAEILNPRVRQRLVRLVDYVANCPFLSFVEDRLFFALHAGLPLLEPTLASPASYATVSVFGIYFALPTILVREIAPGATPLQPTAAEDRVGPAILAEPAAEGLAERFAADPETSGFGRGAAGPVAEEDVTAFVMERADERDLSLQPPPESRVRLSPLTGEGLTVSFGLDAAFFWRVLWVLALTPFVAGGVARLIGEPGAATLAALSAQAPGVATVAELAGEWPILFAIFALIFHVLPALALIQLPRALQISRQGVRIDHRLWPVASVHAIDRIASVRVSDLHVALERRGASLLRRYIYPTPQLPTEDDARWLAAHLRRALLMFGGLRDER